MLIWTLKTLFGTLIGRLPEEKKQKAWEMFLQALAAAAPDTAQVGYFNEK